jgi:hypothetical protein
MRKLLLASAATMGALLATNGVAHAQMAPAGTSDVIGGVPAKPIVPAPGTVVVHLDGLLTFSIGDIGSTLNTVGAYKANPVSTEGDARIYAGFDAQTLNGVLYGAQIETRISTSNATVGANATTGTANNTGDDAWYVKRAYGYIGTKGDGIVRLGQTDSAFSLLQTGVIEAFGDGQGFNSDGGIESAFPTDAAPGNFVFADQSKLYATDKIVYTSPKIAGFVLGAGYEPNSNGIKEGYAGYAVPSSTNAAGTGTAGAAIAASPLAADIGSRRKNTVDANLQYSLLSDGFLTKANFGVIYGAPIAYDGAPVATGALHYGYDNLYVYQAGVQTTFAGLTLGANVKAGQTLDGYAFKVRGTRDALTYIVSGNYIIGPYVLGAYLYDGQTAGSYTPGAKEEHTLSEYGVAAGGNYVISPELSLFAQYLYGHRHQLGNAGLASASGNDQVQSISTGAIFKW